MYLSVVRTTSLDFLVVSMDALEVLLKSSKAFNFFITALH